MSLFLRRPSDCLYSLRDSGASYDRMSYPLINWEADVSQQRGQEGLPCHKEAPTHELFGTSHSWTKPKTNSCKYPPSSPNHLHHHARIQIWCQLPINLIQLVLTGSEEVGQDTGKNSGQEARSQHFSPVLQPEMGGSRFLSCLPHFLENPWKLLLLKLWSLHQQHQPGAYLKCGLSTFAAQRNEQCYKLTILQWNLF